jgi:hypothetical protein
MLFYFLLIWFIESGSILQYCEQFCIVVREINLLGSRFDENFKTLRVIDDQESKLID